MSDTGKCIHWLNATPSPKQKKFFKKLTGLEFPLGLIVTRFGANLAIRALMHRAKGIDVHNVVFHCQIFARAFRDDQTVYEHAETSIVEWIGERGKKVDVVVGNPNGLSQRRVEVAAEATTKPVVYHAPNSLDETIVVRRGTLL